MPDTMIKFALEGLGTEILSKVAIINNLSKFFQVRDSLVG
jgi:hypothetical protein